MISPAGLSRFQTALVFFLTGIVVSGFCLGYRFGDDFRWVDNFIYDLHLKWRAEIAPTGNLVLVVQDQKSAKELERVRGHWSRRQLAEALDHLCAAGADIIGMDMIFHAPDPDPEADRVLAGSMAACGNVVLAWGALTHGGDLLPLEIFREAALSDGFIDLPLDTDEVLRRVRFFKTQPRHDGLELLPAFSLELARTFLNIDYALDFSGAGDTFSMGAPGGKQLRLPNPNLLIDYAGDAGVFASISYADVVNNRFFPNTVRGKIVLIGTSLATSKDVFTTPYTRFQKTGGGLSGRMDRALAKDLGVACQAHATDTILGGRYIRRMPERWVLLLTVVSGVMGMLFYMPRIGLVVETAFLAAGLAAVVGSAHLLFVKKLLWMDAAPLLGVFAVQFVCGVSVQTYFGKRRTDMVTAMFGKYVSPHVVKALIQDGISLEGRRQEVTILFSDLRGFTALSERLGPQDTGVLLNTYFNAMLPAVFEHQGTLDKLMGDAVMAFYGAPIAMADHPVQAAETALKMQDHLARLRRLETVRGAAELQAGIGLNTGTVTVGNLGSDSFMDYTIVGDPVNLASRLEGLTKVYGVAIVISEFTARRLDPRFLVRELDRVRVKGKAGAVTVYELAGYTADADRRKLEIFETFQSGIFAYRDGQWDTARKRFENVLGLDAQDGPARLYLERIRGFDTAPPEADWDGVTVYTQK